MQQAYAITFTLLFYHYCGAISLNSVDRANSSIGGGGKKGKGALALGYCFAGLMRRCTAVSIHYTQGESESVTLTQALLGDAAEEADFSNGEFAYSMPSNSPLKSFFFLMCLSEVHLYVSQWISSESGNKLLASGYEICMGHILKGNVKLVINLWFEASQKNNKKVRSIAPFPNTSIVSIRQPWLIG